MRTEKAVDCSAVCRKGSSSSAVVNTFQTTLSHGMKQFPKIKKEVVIVLINLLMVKKSKDINCLSLKGCKSFCCEHKNSS